MSAQSIDPLSDIKDTTLSAVFITAIILLVIGLIMLPFLPTEVKSLERPGETFSTRPIAFLPLGLAVVFLILSCFTVVGTRNVGVPTSFGKTTGDTYGAGLHPKAPWVKVTDVDATIQPEEYRGKDCIYVKIADGGSACVSLAYRWRINAKQADVAFVDYRKSDDGVLEGIRKALVSTNIKAAINEVLGKYDPLVGADLKPDMTPNELANVKINVVPDYQQINADIQTNLESKIAKLGGLIDIQSVTVSYLELPESTQKRINAFNAAVQDTKIALQQIATKDAQAEANRRLASSLKDPAVLVSKCLDGLISGEITGFAGFQCWPGSGSAVVLPSVK